MDENMKTAYENLDLMLVSAENEGWNYLSAQPREDGRIEITSSGITYVVILERKD